MNRRIPDSTLADIRNEILRVINEQYETVEQFCWDKNLSKATISNILNNKKDFSVSTLIKISTALNKKLKIKMENI
jgi:transcriptional regulator with XRE-family HTH domain